MGMLKVGLCLLDEKDNVVSYRPVKKNWTVNITRDLNNIYATDEISKLLTESFKLELEPKTIKEMLVEVKEKWTK